MNFNIIRGPSKWGRCFAVTLLASLPLLNGPSAQALRFTDSPIRTPVFNCTALEADENYINFESGPVRPIATSHSGNLLFVANSAANCLEIFATQGAHLQRISALSVGVDPVAVAVRNDQEVWVVNHMSDSISIVSLKGRPQVIRTLLVGDEPRDIVFAGSQQQRAFITTAHRGQNHPGFNIQNLRSPGIGRADVWVYDAENPGAGLSGTPLSIVSLFTDTPRALEVSADGRHVYAAGFLSGNQTTVLMPQALDQPKAEPNDSAEGIIAPNTGLIVRFNGEHWVDELGQTWDHQVLLNLPDKDLFKIDADANPPAVIQSYTGLGTVLFNLAVNPVTGVVYASNTEAFNEVRFEGPGSRSTSVRGRFLHNRITLIDGDQVSPQHLNPHVDFSLPFEMEASPEVKAHSLSQPMDMQVTADGQWLYVSAFGSSHVVRIKIADLIAGNYDPYQSQHIDVPGGPAGLVLSPDERFLYVYSMFDNLISVIDTRSDQVVGNSLLYNPEPDFIREGRPLLYDAHLTSGNGTVSCAGCHVFGDFDGLAWDLGNPDGFVTDNPLPESPGNLAPLKSRSFHPLKGPMTTQTFRGIDLSGAMHWRGDRPGLEPALVNGQLESQEAAAFKQFNEAFVVLLGRGHELDEEQMQKLTDFVLAIESPPNPIASLDGRLTPRMAKARDDYFTALIDSRVSTCDSCHKLDAGQGMFGTDRKITSEGPLVSQDFKIPHLRNMYQKIGMFGTSFLTNQHMGDQIRGFGYGHDGTFANVDDFLQKLGSFFFSDLNQAESIAEFVWAFPSEQAASVGQQVTLSAQTSSEALERAAMLVQQAQDSRCDLVVSAQLFGASISGQINTQGALISPWLPPLANDSLLALSAWADNSLTYTCVPLGTGAIYGY